MKLKITSLILLLVFCFPIGFTENISSVNAQTRSRRKARLIIHRKSGNVRRAVCRDGSISLSRNRRGTCSRHGGVRRWLR